MATNYVQPGTVIKLPTATGMSSGDPFVVGDHMPCVLTTDAETASPYNSECALVGVFDLSVKGHDGSTNSAVIIGDPIYYTAGSTPVLDKDSSGKFFGIAVEALASGATGTIKVKLQPCCVVDAAS